MRTSKNRLRVTFFAMNFFLSVFLAGLIFCAVPAPAPASQESSAVYLDLGVELFQKGRLDQAIAEFNQAIELNPRDAEAYNYRGSAYLKKGQIDRAIADYDQVLRLKPRYAEAYTDRGVAYGAKGQYDRAIADFNRAVELNPRYAPAWSCRGGMYLNKGQIDRAIADFSKAVEVDPGYAMGYNNRGTAYMQQKRYDQAIFDFDKALRLDPRQASAYANRGIAYFEKGQIDRAITDLTRALEIDPGVAPAYEARAKAYTNKGEYQKAWQDVTRAQKLGMKVDPDFLRDLRQLAPRGQEPASRAVRPAEALSEDDILLYPFISRAKQVRSGHARLPASQERKFRESGSLTIRPGEHMFQIEKLPARLSEKHHETIMQARELYARQQYREAAALLRPALQDEPENMFILDEMARTLFRIKEGKAESFILYKRLINLQESKAGAKGRRDVVLIDMWFPEAYWKLGCLYLDRREYDQAVYEISLALMFLPRSGPLYEQALSYLCEAYYHLGNYKFARYLGNRVLELNPGNKYVLPYLARMKDK
jgi:type IV pilus biogenesis/stability protein PilW